MPLKKLERQDSQATYEYILMSYPQIIEVKSRETQIGKLSAFMDKTLKVIF